MTVIRAKAALEPGSRIQSHCVIELFPFLGKGPYQIDRNDNNDSKSLMSMTL